MKKIIFSAFLFASSLTAQVQLGRNVQIGAGGGGGCAGSSPQVAFFGLSGNACQGDTLFLDHGSSIGLEYNGNGATFSATAGGNYVFTTSVPTGLSGPSLGIINLSTQDTFSHNVSGLITLATSTTGAGSGDISLSSSTSSGSTSGLIEIATRGTGSSANNIDISASGTNDGHSGQVSLGGTGAVSIFSGTHLTVSSADITNSHNLCVDSAGDMTTVGCTGGGSFITSLTTTGSSGPSTVSSGVLNIPQYSGGAVSSVSNSDSTLTISPTTGSVVASLNLAHANTWTAPISVAVAGGLGGSFDATEGNPATPLAGHDKLYADSTAHCLEYSANGGSFACIGTGGTFSLTDNIFINSPATGKLFVEADSIGLIANGGFPEKLATLLTTPSGNQSITALGSASLADMLSCDTPGSGSCTQDGTWPLTFPLGVASNSKALLEAAYNDLSNMGSTPTNNQLSYYFGGLKAWMLEFGIPDSQKLAANGAYCTTTGTWTAATTVPGGAGTFPAGTIQTSTPGATLVCTTRNATDAGIIGYKYTGSTTATYTVSIVNGATTYNVSDPYTASTTLNQTAAYTSAWSGKANLYAVGKSGMAGGYTTITLTAASNTSDPVIVVAPYFISPSSSLQNFPAVEVMLESRAGCNGACSSVAGAQHNDTNTNIMRTAQMNAVNELRSNGLNVSYFDPNATPSGFNSSDSAQTSDGTHPNSTAAQLIANTAFVNLNSAATAQDHFLPSANSSLSLTTTGTSGAATLSGGALNIPVYAGVANTTTTVGTTAIAANTCTTATTVTMTGVATTTTFGFTPNADVSGTTGWGSVGGLTVDAWPTTNTLNYKVCNQTASSITPGASVTFNVSAR